MEWKFQHISYCSTQRGSKMDYGYMLVLDNPLSYLIWKLQKSHHGVQVATLDFERDAKDDFTTLADAANYLASLSDDVSFASALVDMQARKHSAMERMMDEGHSIFIAKGGSWMVTYGEEDVLKEVISDKFSFPQEDKFTEKDIKVDTWPQGRHFYAWVGGNEVIVNNEQKWNTADYARSMAVKFMNELNNA